MVDFIEMQWTSGSLDEARKISRYLVQERYVASAQIIPWVESIYLLNNRLETTQESKIILKTRIEYYEKVKEIIQQNCKYQIAEISYAKLEGANKEYQKWLEDSTSLPV